MPPLEDNRRDPQLNGIDHREHSPTDVTSIRFGIANPNANRRQRLSGRLPQSFRLQSAIPSTVFPERFTINSNPIGDRYAFA